MALAVENERARSAEERAAALRQAIKKHEDALARAIAAARQEAAANVETCAEHACVGQLAAA